MPSEIKFEYQEIPSCTCGAVLLSNAHVITKTFSRGQIFFVRCQNCGTWMQSPRLTSASRAAWFDSEEYRQGGSTSTGGYIDYAADEAHRLIEGRARYQRDLARLLPSQAKILEVGCATGSFLKALADAGHSVTGIDLSAEFIQQGRALYPSLDLCAGNFLQMTLPPGSFDYVITLGSLLTLDDAREFVRFARKALKPGGCVYFNVPVADSWISWLYGKNFQPFSPSVCAVLSKKCCRQILADEGFEIVRDNIDWQQPGFRKILVYLRLGWLQPLVRKLGLESSAIPFSLPAFGVNVYLARQGKMPR